MIMLPLAWAVVVGMLLLSGGAFLCAALLTVLGRWPRGFSPFRGWGLVPRRAAPAVWRLTPGRGQAGEGPMGTAKGAKSAEGRGKGQAGRIATCAACGRGLTAMDTIFVRGSGAVQCHRCAGR